MTARFSQIDIAASKAAAREAASGRKTCEGCALLRTYTRPMCAGEKSPHFRTARDTYHERCQWYSVRGHEGRIVTPDMPPPEPEPEPTRKRMKLVKVRGSDRVVTEKEYDRLLAKNRSMVRA